MSAEVVIDIEGLVYVADWELVTIPRDQVPLDKLVADAVAAEMLKDELLAEKLLSRFRERLQLSLDHVDNALGLVRRSQR